ncbi:hypothetical protein VNO77_02507 [Canavalia gladiata]|uniref:Uncharacterized protein n=1 Tax=Canavalia gladiata TaxID=3824 RepID=A0AAN9MTS9_CANGL
MWSTPSLYEERSQKPGISPYSYERWAGLAWFRAWPWSVPASLRERNNFGYLRPQQLAPQVPGSLVIGTAYASAFFFRRDHSFLASSRASSVDSKFYIHRTRGQPNEDMSHLTPGAASRGSPLRHYRPPSSLLDARASVIGPSMLSMASRSSRQRCPLPCYMLGGKKVNAQPNHNTPRLATI